ncbi:HAMP domain-containing histidine kinase [bacterium]|nr:HAMP domain-containing histidine kinase [bacterium]
MASPEKKNPDPVLDNEMNEEVRAAINRYLESHQGLEKMGLLVAGIAHNLAGPLSGLLGTVDLLSYKFPDLKNDFDRIRRIGKKLQQDIYLLSNKAKHEYLRDVGEVNFIELINNEIEFYKADPRFKHFTDINFTHPDTVPVFRGIPGDFSQILANLFTNACEAMDHMKQKQLDVTLMHVDDSMLISIKDYGVGMDTETKEKAFDPFFSTKTPRPANGEQEVLATGIGLTHVKNLLDDMGGTIRLESKLDEGTTATMLIPYKKLDEKLQAELRNKKPEAF